MSAPPGDYALLDSGDGRKLERFGSVILSRPCAQALWKPRSPGSFWDRATATFSRDGGHRWSNRDRLPHSWAIEVDGLRFKLAVTDFGHLGLFPEQRDSWSRLATLCSAHAARTGRPASVLNLFAYSGGSTLACARSGAEVCHVDASRGMVDWARENAALNGLETHPIRWIVDDVARFIDREQRRGRRYDGIILDPPSFGRGARGEVFKIESDLPPLLTALRRILSDDPAFFLLSCHTPELTPLGVGHLLDDVLHDLPGSIATGELCLQGPPPARPLPSGTFALWEARG